MKNKFISMLVGIFLIPIACRTETDYVDKEEAKQPFAVFSTTSNNNVAYRKNSKTGSDQIDYASGFAYLLQRHDSIHHKNNTGLVNSSNETTWDDELKQHFIKKSSSAFIEFRIKSQTVVQENQDKWVVFPKIENDKVIDLVGVVLSDSETDVRYYYIDRESEFYKDNVSLFQEKYNKYFTKSNRTTANRDAADRDIDEVTLTHINRRPWWDTGKQSSKGDAASAGGGRCGEYNDCKKDDRGGSGGGGEKPQDRNPCEKIKKQNESTNYKIKLNEYNKASNFSEKKEKGFYETKDGWFYSLEQSQSTSSSDGLKFPISSDIKGYTHTHLNDYETGKTDDSGNPEERQPIRMFSPADVNALMELAKLQSNGNYGDLYGVMLSSSGNYTIKFTGTAADIKTGFDTDDWREDYKKFVQKESGSLEKKFLRFLSEKMGVKGISLFKNNSDGKTQKKSLSSNNNVQTTDCP